ncbi:hypothetical protein [Planktothrix agardhii]|jgi:hypothetical protein|uniref:Uncharacterized protein n=2 Tax=Planktothrix TaxID=54304 RepID=A0AAD1Q410_PLAAG|nr:hypothetical protein [Planktothrix agardhii]BBD55939.1 hypothetical protein NIES204_32580 [Planktothrix agardhii NIES-204]MCB8758949.1 hypothetical protein [Planktothrix agardhii 1813]MCB8789031.1 hypothetical protein [Planktothrix agardhii 1025]MCF3569196.1 hypothetical protein [Planktothrix agardhii 1807]MCF3571961.1 hypothetical protein [Planktothrix agardhii 1805]
MTDNRISANLTPEDVAAIQAAILTIKEKLPFLVGLTKEERISMLKLGDKSRAFVQKTMELVKQNQDFLPRSFDIEEMEKDVELYNDLYPVLLSLHQLNELVEDTLMVVGSEAYAAALVAYRYAKEANLGAGLDGVLDNIGRRFARKSNKAVAEPTEGTNPASKNLP